MSNDEGSETNISSSPCSRGMFAAGRGAGSWSVGGMEPSYGTSKPVNASSGIGAEESIYSSRNGL